MSKGIYTITPTKYEGKYKTSDVWFVKFNRELTAEERAALNTFMRGQLTEGKKTSRGWYDRKQEGYMMRSEEAARQLGEMLGNEEAVADAQPMTAQELREAVAPAPSTEKPAKQERKPKKAPINRVSLEDVMTDLSTKGETRLSDHAEPVKTEPEVQHEISQGAISASPQHSSDKSDSAFGSHEISDDEMQSLANELRDLLGIGEDEGDAGLKFRDPGELTPQERQRIQSAGIRLAMGLVERGTTYFPDYATKMVGLLGDKIRPWLKSFYEGARWTPGYENIAFTPSEEVARFDVQNFDKEQANPIAQAAMIVEERKASTASAQAQKELTEIRNNKRKKQDEQTSADTAALAKEAEAVASEAEATADSAKDERAVAEASEKVDNALDKINKQLAILGYFERKGNDPVAIVERKAAEAGADLAARLVDDLGLKLTDLPKDVNVVSADFGEKGGYVRISLPVCRGYEPLRIDIRFDRTGNESLRLTELMTTLKRGDEQSYIIGEDHQAWLSAPTYGELISTIKEQIEKYLPKEEAFEVPEFWHNKTIAELEKMLADVLPKAKSKMGKSFGMDKIARGLSQYIESRKAKEEAPTATTFPDPKDKEAVSDWLEQNSEAIWKGVDAIMDDARQDENLLNIYGIKSEPEVRERVIGEYIDKWIGERIVRMMDEHPATVKAWYDYGQRDLIADVVDERMAKVVADEVAKAKAEETHNGYKRGDEVMWDRNGNGKWEKQVIKDFDEYGNPILDSFGTNWISEVGDWERIKPADGIFGEAKRVATKAQQERAEQRREDNQGNPIDGSGKLILDEVKSVGEITDEDFMNPTRNVALPKLPEIVSDAIGAEGRRPIIKKNIFEKNRSSHKDLTAEDGRRILHDVLYNPNLYGQNQKVSRPYNWILVHLADKNSSVILEVNPTKENLEIVNWHYLNGRQLEQKKRQAEREGGRILTLQELNAVGNTSHGLSFGGKVTKNSGEMQGRSLNSGSSSEAKAARVEELSEKLNTPIRIISEASELSEVSEAGRPRYNDKERRAKGWWSSSDNGVVVVLPNNVNVADVDNTVVHEVVGHNGLRALIGEERFDAFLNEVYDHSSDSIRKRIMQMTDRMVEGEVARLRERKRAAHERAGEDVNAHYYSDMAEARTEAEARREDFRREATEEYMADLGGRIGSEGFEKMSREELTIWGKIKAKVQQFLDKFLQGLKIAKSIRLNDKDLSYILYKSWKNLRKKGMFADAEDVVRRRQSGYDADDVTRFRDSGLGLEETITRMKTEAMQANAGNLQAKQDAMRAIGGNLNHLRQAMARQREYDITTVKSVSDLARVLMEAGLLDDLSKYETKRILGAINNVVGKQDVSQYHQY